MRLSLAILSLLALVPFPASASSSHLVDGTGAVMRLVTSGEADPRGLLRGALDIALKPGWKTYWRDPGDTGIPPQIDVSRSRNVKSAAFSFPAPQRIEESYGVWAGYTAPVTLPVTFTLDGPADTIIADVFLGVCRQICIPFQASLSLDPNVGAQATDDRAVVDRAFASLPAKARPGFRVHTVRGDSRRLYVEAEVPAGAGEPQLFVVSTDGYVLRTPELAEAGNGVASFVIEISKRAEPGQTGPAPSIDYTLVAGQAAVAGAFSLQGILGPE
jgi:DsbC/DsbD-like thiol-disulfide interchange protein